MATLACRFTSKFKHFTQIALDLFYPRKCFYSGLPLAHSSEFRYIHPSTLKDFQIIKGHACIKCGVPFSGDLHSNHTCPNCLELKPVFSEGKALFLLKGPARTMVHNLKYHDSYYLWPDVEKLALKSPHFINFISNAILVPVPLHPTKLKRRGFNQSYLLSQSFSRIAENTTVLPLLKRVKNTQSQTHLTKLERKSNVKKAFAFFSKSAINRDLKYIIIDDVFTTGSTLNECAKVLKKHGINNIKIATLGHG